MKAASRSSTTDSDVEELPLVDCPDCGKHVIKLRSKQAATYGRVFYKCEENVKDDPLTCGFYKWENEYRSWLRRKRLLEDVIVPCSSDDKFHSGRNGEVKQQILELKPEIAHLTNEIRELKQQIVSLRTMLCIGKKGVVVDSVCVALVGCLLGIVVAVLCKYLEA
ncbi:uncharacterized protein LOC133884023 [Phragmites australis]|uniref:uncharacterized protein LOC133884023 n=1 Tax=Phragmites australis TaxID=29695 RepID=UPI002D78AF19|nr:uncharacterized protein LOC133884023 [Phragmites australis]